MPRKRRPLDRTQGVERDASLIVIACEDTHAVKQYLAKFRTRRVQFEVLPTLDGGSSPADVLQRLDDYKKNVATEERDQLWLCIDADHWIRGHHQRSFADVIRQCRTKNYQIAISNPCFEVWLLMHFEDVGDALYLELIGKDSSATLTKDERESVRCDALAARLCQMVGGYKKSNVSRLPITPTHVMNAVERARLLSDGSNPIPPSPGSHFYQLIDILSSRDAIDLS